MNFSFRAPHIALLVIFGAVWILCTYSRDMCRLRELEQHLMELDLDLNRTHKLARVPQREKCTTRKICQIGQNELFVSTAISKMASLIVLLFRNLNQVRNCWTFISSELTLPTWVRDRLHWYSIWSVVTALHTTLLIMS